MKPLTLFSKTSSHCGAFRGAIPRIVGALAAFLLCLLVFPVPLCKNGPSAVWLWAVFAGLLAALPLLYGRFLFALCYLAGFFFGLFAPHWFQSEYRPGLPAQGFAVFLLCLLFFGAFGILVELAVYFTKHRQSPREAAFALLSVRGFRAGMVFFFSFATLAAPALVGRGLDLGLGLGQNEPAFALVFSALLSLLWFCGAFWAGSLLPVGFLLGGFAKDLSSNIRGPFADNGMARLVIVFLAVLVSVLLELFFLALKKAIKGETL